MEEAAKCRWSTSTVLSWEAQNDTLELFAVRQAVSSRRLSWLTVWHCSRTRRRSVFGKQKAQLVSHKPTAVQRRSRSSGYKLHILSVCVRSCCSPVPWTAWPAARLPAIRSVRCVPPVHRQIVRTILPVARSAIAHCSSLTRTVHIIRLIQFSICLKANAYRPCH